MSKHQWILNIAINFIVTDTGQKRNSQKACFFNPNTVEFHFEHISSQYKMSYGTAVEMLYWWALGWAHFRLEK